MKNIIKISGIIVLVLSFAFVSSCKKDKVSPPEVTTAQVSDIAYTTATSGGSIVSDGGGEITAKGICWGENDSPTTDGIRSIDGTGQGDFSSRLTVLTPNTLYYVRAYATNSGGTGYGDEQLFTTNKIGLPEITTKSISSVLETSALSGGDITDDKGAAVTKRGVCWSTSENPTIASSKTSDGSGIGVFSSTITGLTVSTTYYLRAYATNSLGTAYGNQLVFTTNPVTPLVMIPSH